MSNKGLKAFEQLQEWRANGAPDYVTAYEAHNLTNGKVGAPYGTKNSTKPMRLVEVAIKSVK